MQLFTPDLQQGGLASFHSLTEGLAAGPLVLFDGAKPRPYALALAPSSSFNQAQLSRAGSVLQLGVHGLVATLPAQYEISFALVGHSEGINGAMWSLGQVMQRRGNTTSSRLTLAEDPISSSLHYETDAGANYCYCHYAKDHASFPVDPVIEELKAYHQRLGLNMSLWHFDPFWWSVDTEGARCIPYNFADTLEPSSYHFPNGLGALNVSTFLLF